MMSSSTLASGLVLATACLLALSGAEAKDDVVHLTSSTFQKVLKSDEVWLVEFYAPWCGHCKSLAPEWSKAASALKGVVKVAAVDATAEQSLAQQYQIQGFPTIKVFSAGGSPTDYQGQRTAKAIADFGVSAAQKLVRKRLGGGGGGGGSSSSGGGGGGGRRASSGGGAVVELTDDNFDEQVLGSSDVWFVEFFAPWCGHCKRLAPEWEEAAEQLEGQVKFGAVDATVHSNIAGQFGVQGYPTIKYFAAGSKSGYGDAQDYNGGRTASEIVAEATRILDETGAPPDVTELTSKAVWDENCGGKKICILSVLPHVLDTGADGRNAYLDMLRAVATKKRKLPFRFLWTSVGQQAKLEEALGLTFGFPAAVAVNQGKQRFATHTGAFDEAKMSKFCDSMMTGRARSSPIKAEAIKVVDAEAWDGKDGVIEEEDDDDIMAELMKDL